MENPEGVLNLLDEFAKVKSKEIPNDLEEYLLYVAASGDPVYQWSLIKSLYRQKLINVITEFYENCPMMDIPACPNVDPFNYETMKNSLLERLDSFASAPFTIQRISELLTTPTKQYNRVDKFMRAIEKNIWVVSTREPGQREQPPAQDASGNLVNGVAPRVRVTVKHPKRGKSIEERIKSGHPQLIDDDDEEEEEEEDDAMEGKSHSELITNNDSEDTPLQCTSVKDLIEKYENGTIFCGTEEKTVQLEESAIPAEPNSTALAVEQGPETMENPPEQESDEEEVNIEKLVTSEECSTTDLVEASEGDKLKGDEESKDSSDEDIAMPLVEVVIGKDVEDNEASIPVVDDVKNKDNDENDINDINDVPMPLVEVVKDESTQELSESCQPDSTNFCGSIDKTDITLENDESLNSNQDSEAVTVMEVLGLESKVESNDIAQVENI